MQLRRFAWFLALLVVGGALSACAAAPSPTPPLFRATTVAVPTASATPFPPTSPTPLPPTLTPTPTATPLAFSPAEVHFAVIGDFGFAGPAEAQVAKLVHSWNPDFILTVGDNNYPVGARDTVQANVLQYYGQDIRERRFFPTLGNHDWYTGNIAAFLLYLHPPHDKRYYDFAWGPVHIFVLDSCKPEKDGIGPHSKQARWLEARLAAAKEPWKIVALHHPPYSSGPHGSQRLLQWPYAQWGAAAVIAGHDHDYERILRNGIVYFVDGLGGVPGPYYFRATPVQGSVVRYRDNYGALRVEANARQITFQFITIDGKIIDTYTLTRKPTP